MVSPEEAAASSEAGQQTAAKRSDGGLDGFNELGANEPTMTLPPLSPQQSPVRPPDVPSFDELSHPLLGMARPSAVNRNTSASSRSRSPIPSGLKDRTVKWGASGLPMMSIDRREFDDDVLSHISNPDFHLHRHGAAASSLLADPMETEADALIQHQLDRLDPTRPGPSEAQQTILGHVPEEAEPAVFAPGDAVTPKLTKPTLHRAATHTQTTNTKSTAEDLFQLASDLSVLNKQHGMSTRGLHALESLRMDDSNEFSSDQDKLIKNAVTLMKRNNAAPKDSLLQTEAGHGDAGSPKPTSATHDRWNALKATIHANAAKSIRDLSKKTDEEDDLENQETDQEAESSKEHHSPNFHTDGENMRTNSGLGRSHPLRATTRMKIKSRYKDFEDWIRFKKMSMFTYLKFLLLFLTLPALGVAAILYYLVGNPPCGTSEECNDALETQIDATTGNSTLSGATGLASITKLIFDEASASWWVLFVCCRQPLTLSLALATQAFIIEFLALRTKWAVQLIGPFATLFVVQSKGWPFILFWWGVYDFVLLYGSSKFARHWLYWQEYVDLFNDQNPAGSFVSAPEYKSALIVAMVVSVVVAAKRFWVGLWFGKKTYHRYAEDLTTVMKKSLLIGQVAALARDKEALGYEMEDLGLDMGRYALDEEEGSKGSDVAGNSPRHVRGPSVTSGGAGSNTLMQQANLSSIQKIRIAELLGAWEEPDFGNAQEKKAPISAIIQFRQSLSYLNTSFPFSAAFGSASTRSDCVASTEALYKRLAGKEDMLRFDLIASLAIDRNGDMDEEKLKALIKLFRPERDGTLSLLDCAKSIDSVYKELRLLRASVANSTRMDAAFETLFNVVFYFIIICVVLSFLGIDPIVLFASVSGFVIGFAFMIGSAAAQFFSGAMFIIYRKPYDIGDRINVSNPMTDTPGSGSPGWIVKDVDLFTTTVLYGSTNEVATYANSTLATCRIINGARSPKASVSFAIKFPLDVSYKLLKVFKGAVEEFIKARPREWRAFSSFRANRVEVDLGFVEYSVCAEHRESWQHSAMISQSKADLTSFCLELSKKMNMRYRSPSKPVELTFANAASALSALANRNVSDQASVTEEDGSKPANRSRSNTLESVDWRTVSAMFEQKK
ncbi:hypothetical protein MPSEU_000850200 [Mayamaea pseudoterrestris]|nr:hypothetical protein MPSEU_000850200 [Mayamaea pseudoterrestris]